MKITRTTLNAMLMLAVCTSPLASQGAVFFDDLESFAVGSQLHGQGGWSGWDNVSSAGALVSSAFAFSGTRSVNITGASDLTHSFSGATSGLWTFSAMQYVPSTSAGDSFLILLNQYSAGGTDNWSLQTHVNMGTGRIIADYPAGAPSLPLIKDQWVPFRADIDLTANTVSEFYNGQLLSTHTWKSGATSLGQVQALDLFANGAGPVYYDNISLVPEPSSLALLAVGAVGVFALRRRQAKA